MSQMESLPLQREILKSESTNAGEDSQQSSSLKVFLQNSWAGWGPLLLCSQCPLGGSPRDTVGWTKRQSRGRDKAAPSGNSQELKMKKEQ